MKRIEVNADIGEWENNLGRINDEKIMPYITSANIACAFHAGHHDVMDLTVQMAMKHEVKIGAHPGYPDKEGFGRRAMNYSQSEIRNQMLYQIGALQGIARYRGATINHVKPHGALYNHGAKDYKIAKAIVESIASFGETVLLIALPASELTVAADKIGVPFMSEVFSDRQYRADGSLVPRSKTNALIESIDEVKKHIESIVEKREIVAVGGEIIKIQADTICVHGDGKESVAIAKMICDYLKSIGR